MASRESLYIILDYIELKDYSREFVIIIKKVKEYYDKDPEAKSVSRELFLSLLGESVVNAKHLERFTVIIDQALLLESSTINVNDLIVRSKQHEIGLRLSTALVNKDDDKVPALIEEYTQLQGIITLEELNMEGTEIFTHENIAEILDRESAGEGSLRLYPLALSDRLGHRLKPGHHLVHFARPEMGKSALNLTIACGFARQSASGLYFINEDRTEDIYIRAISNLTGLSYAQIMTDRRRATVIALERGLANIRFISLSPGTLKQIDAYVEKFQPAWIVVDQLRNLQTSETNKVLQLEFATSGLRNIGKKHHCIVISCTQAGDSAEGKRLLGMGDIDFSNTGVAAQADILVGVGGTEDDVGRGIRYLNICKNKLTGRHESFPARLDAALSRYSSVND